MTGSSSLALMQQLGTSHRTARPVRHKLMAATAEHDAQQPLAGDVQLDDAYLGGKQPGVGGRGSPNKVPMLAAVEAGGAGQAKREVRRRSGKRPRDLGPASRFRLVAENEKPSQRMRITASAVPSPASSAPSLEQAARTSQYAVGPGPGDIEHTGAVDCRLKLAINISRQDMQGDDPPGAFSAAVSDKLSVLLGHQQRSIRHRGNAQWTIEGNHQLFAAHELQTREARSAPLPQPMARPGQLTAKANRGQVTIGA